MNKRGKNQWFSCCNFFPKNSRGLSDVIMNSLMIIISILAIVVVLVVINNAVKFGLGGESGSFGKPFASFQLEKVFLNDDGSVSVTVKRGKGKEDIKKINFLFSDGTNLQVVDRETNLKELEKNTFTFSESELNKILFVKNISIAPVFESDLENESIKNVVDEFKFSNKKILENFGIISWWKFEGDAKDEIGGNHGELKGNVSFVDGNSGKAASFDNEGEYIDLGNFTNLDGVSSFSIVFWLYKEEKGNFITHEGIFARGSDNQKTPWIFGYQDTQSLFTQFETTSSVADCSLGTRMISSNKWTQVILWWDGKTCKFYEDGAVTNRDPTKGNILVNTDGNNFIGRVSGYDYFNGTVDEIMIFDRALTDKQVKALYVFDFS